MPSAPCRMQVAYAHGLWLQASEYAVPLNYWYCIGKNMIVVCLCDCKIEDKDSKKQPNLKAEGADYFRAKELHDGKTQ